MVKFTIRYGIVGGIVVAFYVYFLEYSNLIYKGPYGSLLGYLAIVIMPIITFLALKRIQKDAPDKRLPLTQALAAGFIVSVTAAVSYSILSYAYTHWMVADYAGKMAALEANYLRSIGKSEAEISNQTARIKAHYESMQPYMNTLIWYTLLGLFYTVVSYFILRWRRKKMPTELPFLREMQD